MMERKFSGRGYSQDDKDDKAIYIGNLPGRKQQSIKLEEYLVDGT